MTDTLTPCFLDWRTIDKAYPLVRDLFPGVTVNRWAQFSRAYIAHRSPDRPRGVMTIQNAAGYILALFVFEVRDDLYESRILYLDNIMIPNMPGRRMIWASAIGAAEHLAELNGCSAIRAELGGDLERSDQDLLTSLERSGYSPVGLLTCASTNRSAFPSPMDSGSLRQVLDAYSGGAVLDSHQLPVHQRKLRLRFRVYTIFIWLTPVSARPRWHPVRERVRR